ncbi:glutamate decarboxylase [Hesseltinella vesiculosa]|uniref:Glutamate decarboxylase n=1 Tax=Hesseltinella vesiculosa TaxID=101127 RepID=A0A1X2G7R9_9FUNG|nr:glutamate decarboxylase [Hesseltinella vesiculosa]
MVLLSLRVQENGDEVPVDEKEVETYGTIDYSTAVPIYGSRWSGRELPKNKIPEREAPPHVVKHLIKDELALDGNPALNLASFVTTYMEGEARDLLAQTASVNLVDLEVYPQSAEISARCVNMIANLYHAPAEKGDHPAIGTSTIGSSEAVMLCVLALKRRWQFARKEKGLPIDKPNLVMGANAQVCWHKAVRYLEIEGREVNVTEECLYMDPKKAVEMVDENTIGVVAILGSTFTGHYEDVKTLDKLLEAKCKKTGLDVGIHVDAASGGFVAPFINPDLEWDFRLKRVISINVSGHKYGLVYPGVGWAIWRSKEYLPEDLIFWVNYLGTDQASFTLNFSKGSSSVIAQYYNLLRFGRAGYTRVMSNLIHISDYIADQLVKSDQFILMSATGGQGLPLIAFRLKHEKHYDEYDVASKIRERGWVLPAYTMAPGLEHVKMLRAVVREDMSKNRADILLRDLQAALESLEKTDKALLQHTRDQHKSVGHKALAKRGHHVTPETYNSQRKKLKRTQAC